MKLSKLACFALAIAFCWPSSSDSQTHEMAGMNSVQPLLGRWDLTLKAPDREYPSWLELQQENGELKARLVSRWGHARPLPKAELANGVITFVSPKADEERKDDMVFQGRLSGNILTGTTTGPDGIPWTWTGKRAPTQIDPAIRAGSAFEFDVQFEVFEL